MEDDPLFRRTRQHAERRLTFGATQSAKDRLEQIKEFLRLEKEMLQRYHQKGRLWNSSYALQIGNNGCTDPNPLTNGHVQVAKESMGGQLSR